METKFRVGLFLLISFVFSTISFCQANESDKKKAIFIQHVSEPIKINGKLDNPEWLKAKPVELKYEVFPGDNTPAPQQTFVHFLYDDENLYVGFRCLDTDPEKIRANLSDRDKMWRDDNVLLIIDTYGDYQRSFEFAVNPYGVQGDMLGTINGEDESNDFFWKSAANINDNGWTAEMAIPFSSLSFPDKENQTWVVGLFRNIPRESPVQVSWVTFDRSIPGFFVKQLGRLEGLKNIKSGNKLEFLPYVVGQKSGSLSNSNNPSSGINFNSFKGSIGSGIKYSPGPDISIDAVINPDFSQVEADDQQISVNTTFALYYNEKRPFFLRGNDLIQSPMYYTRSINDPLVAARVIGKSGSLSYMYLGAYDRNTVIVVPGEEQSNTVASSLRSFANIGRLRYDLGSESYIGGMTLTRNLSGGHNYLFGIDWTYRFLDKWYFKGEGFLSHTKELNNTNLFNSQRKFGSTRYDAAFNGEDYSGNGLSLGLSYKARVYNIDVTAQNYSPTYQTYNGLFTSVGYRQLHVEQSLLFYPEDSFINRNSIGLSSYLKYNFDGTKKEQVIEPYLTFELKGQVYVDFLYFLVNDENFFGRQFNNINRGTISFFTKPIKQIVASFDLTLGKFIYRTSNPQIGKGHDLTAQLELKPDPHVNFNISYSRARLSSVDTGQLFYDGNIYSGKLIYHLNSRMFIRTIVQYNSFVKAFQVYPLLSYKLDAFTSFYIGATSNFQDYGSNYGYTNTEQQYFMKFQYLL